jgi:hypothetical protein
LPSSSSSSPSTDANAAFLGLLRRRAAIPTRPSSCCAAVAVAPAHRLGLPPEHSAQLATQCLPPQAPVLACVGAAAAGVLGGAWYGFVVAPRRTSSGHAIHVCATGARSAPVLRAGVRWAKLAWRFGSSGCVWAVRRKQPAVLYCWRGCAAVAGGGRGGGGEGGLADFYPPWLLFVQT